MQLIMENTKYVMQRSNKEKSTLLITERIMCIVKERLMKKLGCAMKNKYHMKFAYRRNRARSFQIRMCLTY